MFAPPSHSTAVMPAPATMVFTAPVMSDTPTSSGRGGVRLLAHCPADGRFNVLVILGLPWHVPGTAVRDYLCRLYPHEAPTTTRLYTHRQNGVSTGSCFVEYASTSASGSGSHGGRGANANAASSSSALTGAAAVGRAVVPQFMAGSRLGLTGPSSAAEPVTLRLEDLKALVETTPFDGTAVEAKLFHLTASAWDREGELPELPSAIPLPARRMLTGYGCEGFVVRCGPQLGLANTVTPEGMAQVRKLRKRWRATQRKGDGGQRL